MRRVWVVTARTLMPGWAEPRIIPVQHETQGKAIDDLHACLVSAEIFREGEGHEAFVYFKSVMVDG